MTKCVWYNIKVKVKQVHSAKCKIAFWLCFLPSIYFQYFSVINKCNMRRVQHGKRKECNMDATWKKCNMEKKSNMKKERHGKSATWKKCSMEKMKHEKSATWKKCNMNKCNMNKCNMEKVQHENSRGVTRSPLTSKMENFAAVFNGFGNYCCKSLHRRCLWGSSLHF